MLLNRKPLILIPGFGGSRLVDICPPIVPTKKSSKTIIESVPKNTFINLNMFNSDWEDKFKLKYDENYKLYEDDNIDVYDFGGIEGIRNLCEDCTRFDEMLQQIFRTEVINKMYNYKYYDTLINRLENIGYISKDDLLGAPYDFRKIMSPEYLLTYIDKLKTLIENSYEKNNKKCIIISHSIGALITYIFLVEYCDDKWKSKYIDVFISISGPYGGSSIALKTLVSGLPKLSFLKEKYHNVLLNSSGMILALPNLLGYNNIDNILFDKQNSKSFNVNEYFDILPNNQYNIWKNNVEPYLKTFYMNTGVKTIFLSCLSKQTEFSYIYDTIDFKTLKRPDKIKTRKGDGVVSFKSLSFHESNRLLFPNYNFININETDHTNILYNKELFRLIISLM
jgi:hypothetical protein